MLAKLYICIADALFRIGFWFVIECFHLSSRPPLSLPSSPIYFAEALKFSPVMVCLIFICYIYYYSSIKYAPTE